MKQENRIVITEQENRLFWGLWEEGQAAEFAFYEQNAEMQLGDIYQARVRDIVPSIRAAFVQLAPEQMGYLAFEEAPNHGEGLKCGQEFPVQIVKEAQKTKDPVVTSYLSLAGRFAVLTADSGQIRISSKIRDDRWKKALLAAIPPRRCGFIIRTEAYEEIPAVPGADRIIAEMDRLEQLYEEIRKASATRKAETRLWQNPPAWLTRIGALRQGNYEIVTDLPEVGQSCERFIGERGLQDRFSVRLYGDPSYSLAKLYQIGTEVQRALDKRVWLKSGAYLVIEPTEAMTVIDVNTGKADSRKSKEEYLLKINEEAADEAARQMRLRNLSGMILIDFIDMKSAENQKALIHHMKQAVSRDPVGVNVVDLTRLGILECTRKKTSRPLHEQIGRQERPQKSR